MFAQRDAPMGSARRALQRSRPISSTDRNYIFDVIPFEHIIYFAIVRWLISNIEFTIQWH